MTNELLLESLEFLTQFSTVSLVETDEDEVFKRESYLFREIDLMRSPNTSPCGQRVFILSGLNLLPGSDIDYFISKWMELSGLTSLLHFCTSWFSVQSVTFLQCEQQESLQIFNFLILIELFCCEDQLIYLLDHVNRHRHAGHSGHLSVYQKKKDCE